MKGREIVGTLEYIYEQLGWDYNTTHYKTPTMHITMCMPSIMNGIEIEYIGTTDGTYPPYHLNESMIGTKFKLWAGVNGCGWGYVGKNGGCFDAFDNWKYIFKCYSPWVEEL